VQYHWSRHTDIASVSFSPSGLQVVSGSDDSTVRVWDTATGILQRRFVGHTKDITSVTFSADGQYIVSGSCDHTIRIWDMATDVAQTEKVDGVTSVAFSSDGSLIVSCSWDHTVRVWDAVVSTPLTTLSSHTAPVTSATFSPNGSMIASGSYDATVCVWDVSNWVALHILEGHVGVVDSVAFSSSGLHVVSGSRDGSVRIWDAETGMLQHIVEGFDHQIGALESFLVSAPQSNLGLYSTPVCPRKILNGYISSTGITLWNPHGDKDDGVHFALDTGTGWISRRDPGGIWQRLCWLPHERRDEAKLAHHGSKVCIGADSGMITILDFSADTHSAQRTIKYQDNT
jgi:WD40 repeat protein